jgi:hypothetical protein
MKKASLFVLTVRFFNQNRCLKALPETKRVSLCVKTAQFLFRSQDRTAHRATDCENQVVSAANGQAVNAANVQAVNETNGVSGRGIADLYPKALQEMRTAD